MVDTKLLKGVKDLAKELNSEMDAMNQVYLDLEKELAESGIGVETWVLPETELQRAPAEDQASAWADEIGYCKLKDGWRIGHRTVCLNYDKGTGWRPQTATVKVNGINQYIEFHSDCGPIVHASRKVREKMLQHLDLLLAAIQEDGREMLQGLRGAVATTRLPLAAMAMEAERKRKADARKKTAKK